MKLTSLVNNNTNIFYIPEAELAAISRDKSSWLLIGKKELTKYQEIIFADPEKYHFTQQEYEINPRLVERIKILWTDQNEIHNKIRSFKKDLEYARDNKSKNIMFIENDISNEIMRCENKLKEYDKILEEELEIGGIIV